MIKHFDSSWTCILFVQLNTNPRASINGPSQGMLYISRIFTNMVHLCVFLCVSSHTLFLLLTVPWFIYFEEGGICESYMTGIFREVFYHLGVVQYWKVFLFGFPHQ